MPSPHRRARALLLLALCVCACRVPGALPPLPPALPPSIADSIATEHLGRGVSLHTLVNRAAPWRAYVIDADLRCHALGAVKGVATAVGRATTSRLLADTPTDDDAVAAVNGDFFLFAPPGVPTNAHIERGVVISGPGDKPVVWAARGAVGIDTLRVEGTLSSARGALTLTAWNRPAARTTGIVDAHWGVPLDTTVRKQVWRLEPTQPVRPERAAHLAGAYVVRAATAGDTLAQGDTLLLHVAARERVELRVGEVVQLALAVRPPQSLPADAELLEAVGGRPILVADSAVAADVDTEGQASFRELNPRTLVGFDRTGQRAWLVVVDGRRAGYSMGMTLRQEAELMRALGATRALNLDGGGSSALVLRDRAGRLRVVNTPSDPAGERPVANALVLYATCGR